MNSVATRVVFAAAMAGYFLIANCVAAPVSGQGTWESTLLGRDLDGDPSNYEAYYDTVLDITWLTDANYAQTSGVPNGGRMEFDATLDWIGTLNIHGVRDWRLPRAKPLNGSSFILSEFNNNGSSDRGYGNANGWVDVFGEPASEMGHLYYVTLGNLGYCAPDSGNPSGCAVQPEWGLSNTGPFLNIVTDRDPYRTSTPEGGAHKMSFYFYQGSRWSYSDRIALPAMLVKSGDVGVVPIPAAFWLFNAGLIGLVGMARRGATID